MIHDQDPKLFQWRLVASAGIFDMQHFAFGDQSNSDEIMERIFINSFYVNGPVSKLKFVVSIFPHFMGAERAS